MLELCERTADLHHNSCHQGVLLPHQSHLLLPPQVLDLISLEKEKLVFTFPIHLHCLNIALYVSCLFFFFLPPKSALIEWHRRKKSPPPTKRTKTWGASVEERPLPLKFRNKNDSFFWAACSLMWHCDQYQMLGGKDFCQAFPAKIDLTYQLLFVGLTMCVTIKGCCRCIVNTWIVPALCIYYCALPISRKECLALAIDTGPVLQRELNQPLGD